MRRSTQVLQLIVLSSLFQKPLIGFESSGSLSEVRQYNDGVQTIAIGSEDDSARAMAYQPDGKVVITGPYKTGADWDIFVIRLLGDGSLDTSFSSDGLVTQQISANDDIAHAITVDSSSNISIGGSTDNGGDLDLFISRYRSDGNLDTAFDIDGLLTKDIISNDLIRDIETQTVAGSEKILAMGTADKIKSALIIRVNSNGTMDTTFDVDGIQTSFGHEQIVGGVIQVDQKLVTGGSRRAATGAWDYSFERFNTDGSLDTTFDVDGLVTGRLVSEFIYGIDSLQSGIDGEKIIAVGHSENVGAINLFSVRINSNGSLDTTFDVDGVQTNAMKHGRSVFVTKNQKIAVSGFTEESSNLQVSILRFNTNGTLDTTFSNDGLLSVGIGASSDVAFTSINGGDSQFLLAGKTLNANWDVNALIYDHYGSVPTRSTLDIYFDSDGKLSTDVGGDGTFYGVDTTDEGSVFASGDGNTTTDMLVCKYQPDGSLDTSFGTDGVSTLRLSGAGSSANVVVTDSSNRPILGGYIGTINMNFALARFLTNGSLDTSFHIDGIVTTEIGTRDNVIYSATLDASNYIYVTGYAHDGTDRMLAVAKYNTDGSLDTTFSIDGIFTSDIASDDVGYSVRLNANHQLLIGGFVSNGTENRLLSARVLTNGILDTTFDLDGVVTRDLGSETIGYAVGHSEGGKFLVSGIFDDGSDIDYAVIRQNSNGSLDTSFASDGLFTIDIGSDENVVNSMVLQHNDKIFVSGYYLDGTDKNFSIIKLNTNGQLDTAFDTDGLITIDMASGSNDEIRGDTIEAKSGTLIVGGVLDSGSDWDPAVARYFP